MTALLTTYNGSVPGREKQALELSIEIAEYFGKLAAEGKCTPPEQFISMATGKGLWFVKGERDDLLEAMDSEEGKRINAKCMLLLDGFTAELVLSDHEVEEAFMTYGGLLTTV